jgi:hypothetical protein
MARNKYTSAIHKIERAQIARQEKELDALARDLLRASEELLLPVINEAKERRQVRLEHNRRHKPSRLRAVTVQQPS